MGLRGYEGQGCILADDMGLGIYIYIYEYILYLYIYIYIYIKTAISLLLSTLYNRKDFDEYNYVMDIIKSRYYLCIYIIRNIYT